MLGSECAAAAVRDHLRTDPESAAGVRLFLCLLLLPIPTKGTVPAARVSANPRGSCPPQVVELIPSEVPEAFGSCRKFRHVPQVVGVGSGADVRPWELIRCRNGDSSHQKGKSTALELIPAAVVLAIIAKTICFSEKRSVSARWRSERAPQLVGVRCGRFLPLYRQLYPRAGRLSVGLLCAL